MFSAEQFVVAAMLACLAGAGATRLLARRSIATSWLTFFCVVFSSLLVLAGAAKVLSCGPGKALTLLALHPLGSALRFSVDGLSALFLGLIATIALPAAFYSIGYMARHANDSLGRYNANFLVFIAGMYALVSATDMMWIFCGFWQMMTFAGAALIRFE